MCYSVFLSTSAPENLATRSTDLLYFERTDLDEPAASVLVYEHKWYVGSSSGCSCEFRRLMSPELGFHQPENCSPESAEEVLSTARFIEVVRDLMAHGHLVDCVHAWEGTRSFDIVRRNVDLNAVSNEQFRFFEKHHFVFSR